MYQETWAFARSATAFGDTTQPSPVRTTRTAGLPVMLGESKSKGQRGIRIAAVLRNRKPSRPTTRSHTNANTSYDTSDNMALAFRCRHHASGRTKLATDELIKKSNEEEKKRLQKAYLNLSNNRSRSLTSTTPVIPDPAIFATLDHSADLPSIGEFATHLELLEAFFMLQQKVLTSNALDRAFGIVPKPKVQTTGFGRRKKATVEQDKTFQDRRAVKWDAFVRLAAARFQRWWNFLETAGGSGRIQITAENMPPLGTWTRHNNPVMRDQDC